MNSAIRAHKRIWPRFCRDYKGTQRLPLGIDFWTENQMIIGNYIGEGGCENIPVSRNNIIGHVP